MKTKITCRAVSGLLYLTSDEISEQESRALSSHLESCPSCKKTHEDFLITRNKTIHGNKSMPVYPDFTVSTMTLIKAGASSARLSPSIPFNPIWHRTLSIMRYASGIAAVFLLFLFISEQTLSVRKISGLENRIQSTINPVSPGFIDRMTLARSLFTGKEWTDLAEKLNLNQRVTDRYDILRIKNAVEKRLHSKKTVNLAFMASFRSSSSIKRNIINLNNLIK